MFLRSKALPVAALLMVFPILAFGQTVKVKQEKTRIKNEYAEGYEADLPGTFEEIENALNKYLKTLGKTKQNENYFVIAEPMISGRTYTAPLYGSVKQVGNIISAWIGIRNDEWKDREAENVSRSLESMVYEFAVNYHKALIQAQIDEATRASQAVEKQQQRLQNQNRDLNGRVEDNKREKIQLEKSLVNNKLELENLTKRLEKNKKDQDSVAVAGEQIKKVLEMHRERQRSVH